MHHMLTSLSEDDQCIIHFDMTSDDFLALFTEQNINRAEVLGIRLYSGDHRSTLSNVSRIKTNFLCLRENTWEIFYDDDILPLFCRSHVRVLQQCAEGQGRYDPLG